MPRTPIPSGPIRVDSAMIDDIRQQQGSVPLVLDNVEPLAAAEAALEAVRAGISKIAHPDEPDDALSSYVSEIALTEAGGWFWADISDMEEEDDVLNEIVAVAAIAANTHLTSGDLTAKRPDQ